MCLWLNLSQSIPSKNGCLFSCDDRGREVAGRDAGEPGRGLLDNPRPQRGSDHHRPTARAAQGLPAPVLESRAKGSVALWLQPCREPLVSDAEQTPRLFSQF